MASGPMTLWQIEGEKVQVVTDFLFLGYKVTVDGDCSHKIRRQLFLCRKTNLDSVLNSWHYSADKYPYSQGYGLPSGHIWLWELDCKEGRAPKNWCLWTVVLEKTLESPLDKKEIKINLKGNQPWILIGKTDAKAEAPVFWSPDVNSQLIGKVPDAGKDWGRRGHQRMRWLYGITDVMDMNLGKLGKMVRDRKAWCGAVHGSHKESDMTRQLNNNNIISRSGSCSETELIRI